MTTRKHRPKPRHWRTGPDGRCFLDRLHWARKVTATDPRIGEWSVQGLAPSLREILRIAQEMGVDPRWLATGQRSLASYAASRILINSGFQEGDHALAVAEIIPEAKAPNNPFSIGDCCRYCGCVEEAACDGGCEWVDDEWTICSACLEPTEVTP